jgi:hypothetical protein
MIGTEVVPAKRLKKELSRYGYKAAFPYSSQGHYNPLILSWTDDESAYTPQRQAQKLLTE